MSEKTVMAGLIISAFLFSLAAGIQAVNVAKANPIPNEQISPPPIVIQSPLNTTYDQNDIQLNFTVVGASEYYPMTYKLSLIYYSYDGEFHYNSWGMNLDKDQYCTNLTGLSKGEHTLTVYAEGVGSYYISSSQWTQYTLESVQTVTFTMSKDPPSTPSPTTTPYQTLDPTESPIPSPTPTLTPTPSPSHSPSPIPTVSPIMTPSESPTQQPKTEPSLTASPTPFEETSNASLTLLIAGVVVIAIVVVGLLVYFRKRRG